MDRLPPIYHWLTQAKEFPPLENVPKCEIQILNGLYLRVRQLLRLYWTLRWRLNRCSSTGCCLFSPSGQGLIDCSTICWQIGQGMKNLSFPDDSVHQIRISVKLVLDDIVEHFKQEKNQMMVGRIGKEKPRCAKCFQQVKEFTCCQH